MRDVGRTREEFVNHEPQASGYEFFECSTNILSGLSAYNSEKLVVYCFFIINQKMRSFSVGLPAQ